MCFFRIFCRWNGSFMFDGYIPVIGHRMKFMRMLEGKKASTKSDSAVEIFDKVADSHELAISDRSEFSQHGLKRWVS